MICGDVVCVRQVVRGEGEGGTELLSSRDIRGGPAALQVHPRHQGGYTTVGTVRWVHYGV